MKQLKNRKWLKAAAVSTIILFAGIFFYSCDQGKDTKEQGKVNEEQQMPTVEDEQEPIKFGVAGAFSGDLASYGIPVLRAAELVASHYNADNGVNGRLVEVIGEDDVCKPEIAANSAMKLIAEDVDIVLGHVCSGATRAAIEIYKESNIVTMSASATNPALTQSGDYPNFFRTIASDDAQAKLEVDFALDTLNLRKIVVLHDKGDYGKGLAEFAKEFLEKDQRAEVVLYEGVTPGAVDYSAVVQKIKQSGAEAVIFGGYHPEASKIVTTMRKKGMDTIFISADGVRDDTFVKVAGEYAEGVYATGPIDTSKNSMTRAAVKEYRDTYKEEPGIFFLNAYAASLALLNAIEKSGSIEYEAIVNALRTYYVDTPLGSIKFDERGDAIGVGFVMYQVQDGVFTEVK